jgi:hypothetical protein
MFKMTDQWCAFILLEMEKQKVSFTGLAKDVKSSRVYISRMLQRSLYDIKPKGVSLELASRIMKALGVTWRDFDDYLIESEVVL